MNEEYSKGMAHLLELVRDIEENPSQLHCKCTHKDAPQTPDFDWNVFVDRIDTMMKEKRITDSPLRKVRLAIASLSADLTYDNRNRAKKMLHEVVDTLKYEEEETWRLNDEDKEAMKQEQEIFKTSTYLTDEFWQNAVDESKKCKCKCPDCHSNKDTEKRSPVLEKEKQRYSELTSSYLHELDTAIHPGLMASFELHKSLVDQN